MEQKFDIDYVFDQIKNHTKNDKFPIGDVYVKKNDKLKFILHRKENLICHRCKKPATHFLLKNDNGNYFLELMVGDTVQSNLTIDHIVPTSKLAGNVLKNNKQLLCRKCNKNKQNKLEVRKVNRDWKKELLYQSYIRFLLTTFYYDYNALELKNLTKRIFILANKFFKDDFDLPLFDLVFNKICNHIRQTILTNGRKHGKFNCKQWYEQYLPDSYLKI